MVDTTELMYLDTFITEATTNIVVESFLTKRKISKLAGAKKALIEPGEILSVDGAFYKKRFKVKLQIDSEVNLITVINEIIDGTIKYNKRDGTLTEVTTMCNIEFVYSNKAFIQNNIWKQDIYLDVEWVTS